MPGLNKTVKTKDSNLVDNVAAVQNLPIDNVTAVQKPPIDSDDESEIADIIPVNHRIAPGGKRILDDDNEENDDEDDDNEIDDSGKKKKVKPIPGFPVDYDPNDESEDEDEDFYEIGHGNKDIEIVTIDDDTVFDPYPKVEKGVPDDSLYRHFEYHLVRKSRQALYDAFPEMKSVFGKFHDKNWLSLLNSTNVFC